MSIALEQRQELLAGVTYHPSMDELFGAERGGGAFLRRRERQETVSAYFVRTGSVSATATSTTPRGTQTGP